MENIICNELTVQLLHTIYLDGNRKEKIDGMNMKLLSPSALFSLKIINYRVNLLYCLVISLKSGNYSANPQNKQY